RARSSRRRASGGGLGGTDRVGEPLGNAGRAEGCRVDAGVLGVAVGQQLLSPDDRVLVAEAGRARADAPGVDDELVVEPGRDAVAAERLEHESLDALVAQGLIAAGELAQVL